MILTDIEVEEALNLLDRLTDEALKEKALIPMAQFIFLRATFEKMKNYIDFHEFYKNVDKLEACYKLEYKKDD